MLADRMHPKTPALIEDSFLNLFFALSKIFFNSAYYDRSASETRWISNVRPFSMRRDAFVTSLLRFNAHGPKSGKILFLRFSTLEVWQKVVLRPSSTVFQARFQIKDLFLRSHRSWFSRTLGDGISRQIVFVLVDNFCLRLWQFKNVIHLCQKKTKTIWCGTQINWKIVKKTH